MESEHTPRIVSWAEMRGNREMRSNCGANILRSLYQKKKKEEEKDVKIEK